MKMVFLLIVLMGMVLAPPAVFAKPSVACVTIQSGLLVYSVGHYLAGQPLTVGYNEFGYNYQAHLFNGYYANVYLGADGFPPYEGDDTAYAQRLTDEGYMSNPYAKWYWPYRDVWVVMKWNDAWISNKDCGIDGVGGDPDGKLDRHYGFSGYIGSGAWETNHMTGVDGVHWTYFTKIIAAPADATKLSGIWYAADGTEIGPAIWGDFATILEVASGEGAFYVSPAGPGFGKW